MPLIGSRFALSEQAQSGVACSEQGVFVAGVPLLQKVARPNSRWQLRPVAELNTDLGKRYGAPIDLGGKIDSLNAIARALDRGDVVYAQIATLHLRIPDPLELTKSAQSADEIIKLARQLRASGLLKEGWDPTKHPRWPAGSPGGIGGEFAPAGISEGSAADEQRPPVTTAQITIPMPLELPGEIPIPSEIVPAPLIPNIDPRHSLENPYPDRPECVEQWANAIKYCQDLIDRRQLGTDAYRGKGRTLQQCVLGLVSEACGGNSTA